MKVLTDDCDISEVYMETYTSNNGDYYLSLEEGDKKLTYRMSMSGGNLHKNLEARLAFAAFVRAMNNSEINKNS